MATPHLTKTVKPYESDYHMVSGGGHLLVIRHTGVWVDNNPKDLLITPSEEYFSQAVTWAIDYNYANTMGVDDEAARTMAQRLATIRDAKTTSSWKEGHRPLFAYWSRSCPPYRIKADANIDSTKLFRTIELGSCWRLLRFGFRGLPTGMGSVFKAWWRVWNPSCLADTDLGGLGLNHTVEAWTQLHNGAGVMRYKFDGEIHAPKFHQDAPDGVATYGEADIAAIANQGNGNGYSSNSNCILYDIWGGHNGVASASNNVNYHGYEHIRIWAQNGSGGFPVRTPYYADIPITGKGLASLKAALTSGKGAVWAHCGFPTADAMSAVSGMNGMSPGATFLIYCSRLELRISVSWGGHN